MGQEHTKKKWQQVEEIAIARGAEIPAHDYRIATDVGKKLSSFHGCNLLSMGIIKKKKKYAGRY